MRKPRIVYLQYTNPAGYPPLEHSSRILADRGWDVMFLGAAADGAEILAFPPHHCIRVRRLPSFGAGLLQKLNYLAFFTWTLIVCLARRPQWIYASQPMATLPALAIRALTNCRLLYHEHDSPAYASGPSRYQRLFLATRRSIAHKADICVLPQRARLQEFVAKTGREGPTFCVWNCPGRGETSPPRAPASAKTEPLRFYYHGSLNSERLPLTVLSALHRASPTAILSIVGYETIGSKGYMRELMTRAERLDIRNRVHYLGALRRSDMLAEAAKAHIGLSFMPVKPIDRNMAHMVGASNKPFDYMAVGMMLIVSDLHEWRETFVDPGYALACDPSDVDSLVAAMAWCAANPKRVRQMGEAGRQRIAAEWNYERQFEEVTEALRR